MKQNSDIRYPTPEFLPPCGHPRVFFRAEKIPEIKVNMLHEESRFAYGEYIFYLKKSPDEFEYSEKVSRGDLNSIVCKAFEYATSQNTEYAKQAIDAVIKLGDKINFDSVSTYNEHAAIGRYMTVCGFVYDWCYDILTDKEKEKLYKHTIRSAKLAEVDYPPVKKGSVFTHGTEDQIQINLLIPGIAMYDEYPDIYLNSAGRIFSEFTESKSFLASGKCYPGGTHYAGVRLGYDMLCMFIFERMGYPDIYGRGYEQQLMSYLYNRRPDGGILYDGDSSQKTKTGYISLGQKAYFLAANYFNNPYFKNEFLRGGFSPDILPVEFFCFNNPDLKAETYDELPLSRYLPSYRGEMLCRTDWADGKNANTVVADMKINEYNFTEHSHYDSGSFQLYYKGYLATDSGYYQSSVFEVLPLPVKNDGNTHCDSMYANQYQRRTIAHNCITVYDPDEVFYDTTRTYKIENDGGQKAPTKWGEVDRLSYFLDESHGYHVGKVLGHGMGQDKIKPDYTYLKGDLSNAYSGKIESYQRSFMFFNLKNDDNPAALIVFDRVVTSNPNFKKTWLLHTLEEPHFENGTITVSDSRKGYGGKLTVNTVLPKADNILFNKDGGYDTETMSGAKVGNNVYYAKLNKGQNNEAGGWRTEISPKKASRTDYFLNVLQVSEGNVLDVCCTENESYACVMIADRAAAFSKKSKKEKSKAEIKICGEGSFKITVSDLFEGIWNISKNGKHFGEVTVNANDGIACFEGTGGDYMLIKK